jgi:chromosome segregation ATPase
VAHICLTCCTGCLTSGGLTFKQWELAQAERDAYLKEELAAAEQNAKSLADQASAADRDAKQQDAACEAATGQLQVLQSSKHDVEDACRQKEAAYSEANKLHNELVDQYDPLHSTAL